MARLSIGFVLATTLLSGVALAESQAEIAARENEEGKAAMGAENYALASQKFRDAVARVPEAKYFFNLCLSLEQEGKFGEALTACNSVEKNNADDRLKAKTNKLEDKIREDAKKQGVDLQPVGGGGGSTDVPPPDPNNPNQGNPTGPGPTGPGPTGPNGQPPPYQPQYAVGRPPEQSLFKAKAPEHTYAWSLGFDLLGGGGKVGRQDYYGSSSAGFRFKGDYMINPAAKFGMQGYLQYQHLDQGSMQSFADTLDIFDLGLAGYKHFCLGGRICVTPLFGVQLALMSPAGASDSTGSQVFNYTALGARAEIAGSYAFGSRYEHVLSLFLGVNAYSKVFASPSDPSQGLPADMIGLDEGGALAYFGLGYTYRFNTPFGSSPFVTLE